MTWEEKIFYERLEAKEEGIVEGIAEGISQTKMENARNLLGLLPDEVIAEKIGLSIEEVNSLHENRSVLSVMRITR